MNYMTKEKHYNALSNYYKEKYNKKVLKIALNADFTCPNKDGKKGYGGCTFCSKLGSGDCAGDKNLPLKEQFYQIKGIMENKWKDSLYIPYLQANSNTYSDVVTLNKIYNEVISYESDKTIGISIATRADCLGDDIINLLSQLNKKIPVQIELGLQSSNEKTGILINRLITNEEFTCSVKKLRKEGIEVVAHIINGLPNETETDMLNTIDYINSLDIQGIKIHSLLILKDTLLYKQYLSNPFKVLTLDEYVNIVILQLRRLRPDIIIHRLAADGIVDDLIEPKWTIKKLVVMNEIDKKMRKDEVYQGDLYKVKS